jgi:hypothetical protein
MFERDLARPDPTGTCKVRAHLAHWPCHQGWACDKTPAPIGIGHVGCVGLLAGVLKPTDVLQAVPVGIHAFEKVRRSQGGVRAPEGHQLRGVVEKVGKGPDIGVIKVATAKPCNEPGTFVLIVPNSGVVALGLLRTAA